jgi:hypothetical protein
VQLDSLDGCEARDRYRVKPIGGSWLRRMPLAAIRRLFGSLAQAVPLRAER